MNDPQVINTLRTKAENLEGYINKLEADLEQARSDLAHVIATLHLFQIPESGNQYPMHYNIHRLFKPREIGQLCREALKDGPLDTRQLAEFIIAKKEFPGADRHLRASVAYKVVQGLRMQEKRGGNVVRVGKRSHAILWALRG